MAAMILIVEDSETQAGVLQDILLEWGYEVAIASNGRNALELLQRRRPDLVISDILMPEMDGFELCRSIRNDPELRNMPVILLTSLDDPHDVLRSLKAGADNFISKPFDVEFFRTRIEQTLENARLCASNPDSTEIVYDGERHRLDMDRTQMVHLLFSTYEMALHKNKELIDTQRQLKLLNVELERRVVERTHSLLNEIAERKRAEEELQRAHDELELRVQERTAELSAANRKLEEEIEERTRVQRELVAAKKVAESASRAKSEFLANMSHEIRTPLNGIVGMTKLLLETELSPSQRDFSSTISTCADNLLEIVNDVLDYSKIEAGKIVFEAVEFNLRTIMEEVAEVVAVRAYEKGLAVETLVEPEVPLALHGDPGKLRQVLLNLASNAVKFTEKGEVSITASVVERKPYGAMLSFSVCDTGIGIRSDRVESVFQSFTQVDSSTTREFGGTGLGLAICRRLVEVAGGNIGVETLEAVGSTFWFTMPFGVVNRRSVAQAGKPTGVIVAEGSALTRKALENHLRALGCRCTLAATAAEAEAALLASSDRKEVLIVGTNLPDAAPAELLTRFSACGIFPTKAVLLMPMGTPYDEATVRAEGFAAILSKPVKFDQVALAVLQVSTAGDLVSTDDAVPEETGRKIRVLVAEDNLVNQKVAKHILTNGGYDPFMVANGQDAVDAVATARFDLVLMDVQMPVLDGLEATAEIRRREQETGEHLPIIAMTAHALKEDMKKCLESGMDGYICKPVTPDAVLNIVKKHLAPALR